MAGRLSELIVKIGAETSGFSTGVRGVSADLEKMVNSANSAMRGFRSFSEQMSSLGGGLTVGLSLPLAGLGAAAIKADADMDGLMRGLEAVTGSASAAQSQFERLGDVAKLPGLGFEEAVQGAINLEAAGLSAELAERALGAFGNALATVGKGKADLDGVILALGQIESKGKISAEEINQLAERVPQIRQAMKGAFGTADTEELQKMGISATQFVERVTAEFEKLKPVTGGVRNSFENVQDAIQKSLSEIGKSLRPATEELLKFLEPAITKTGELAKEFRDLPPAIQGATGVLIGLATSIPPALTTIGQMGLGVSSIIAALPVLKSVAAGGGAAVAGAVAAAGGVTVVAGIILGLLGTVGAGYYLYNRDIEFATKGVEKNTGLMRAAAENLALSMRPTIGDAGRMADEFNRVAGSLNGSAAATAKQARAIVDLNGAMQGPQTMFQALDMSSRTASAMQKEAAEQLQRVADVLSGKGFDVERFPFALAKVGDQLEQTSSVAQIVSKHWTNLWDEIANTQAAQRADAGIRQIIASLGGQVEEFKKLADARKRLGLSDPKDLGQMAADVGTVKASGAPKYEVRKAELDYLNEKRRQGVALTKEESVALRQLEAENKTVTKTTVTVWQEIQQRLKAVFQDVSKNIVDLAFKGGKFKDVMVGAFEEIGKGLSRLALEKTLGAIGKELGGIVSDIPGLAKISGLLGLGGKAASTAVETGTAVTDAATNAANIANQTSGAVSKAIGSSFTSLAGVVTGAISAVSGIIGNFQAARQEGTLNAIEWNTRKTSLHAEHTLLKINEGIPGFSGVQERIVEVRDIMFAWNSLFENGLAVAGGGDTIINMAGSNFIGFRDLDAFLDELVRRLKQRGA
jgi:tape measure domain-containing protein